VTAEPAPDAGVGVVIATRDRRDTLLATLDRLAALDEPPPVVLVDNGSSDGTPVAVALRHPGVRIRSLGYNAGSAARNDGVRASHTELVAFCDDDSWWAPGALAKAAGIFAAHPRLGLLAARIVVEPSGLLDPTCELMRRSPIASRGAGAGTPVLGFVACGAIVRRRAFLEAGGFHPRVGIGGEEELLALDLAAAGWELAYVDSVTAHHQPASHGRRAARGARELRNGLWTAWLRRRVGGALNSTAALSLGALREGRPQGLVEALRGLPWVLRERRPVSAAVEDAARAVELHRRRRASAGASPAQQPSGGNGHRPYRSSEASRRGRLPRPPASGAGGLPD
jgi:N-acetylglucosaminyl-diphospho-decaprenol L-rhamnosyltransferase